MEAQEYVWQVEAPLAELPPALAALLAGKTRSAGPPAAQPKWVAEAIRDGVGEGQRNSMTTRLAGYFVHKGVPTDVIQEVLTPFAERCSPPLPLADLAAVIASAERYRGIAQAYDIETPPTPEHVGDAYIFTWHDLGIRLSFSHLRQDRDGVRAEVDVREVRPDGTLRRIHRANLNCSSTQSRAGFAKELTSRHPTIGGSVTAPALDWPRVLEQSIGLVVDLSREGEPAILLREAPINPEQWVMAPILPEDEVVVMFANGGSGKSYLAQAFAISIQTGCSVFPAPMANPSRARNVLYLDWETTARVQRQRMEKLWYGAGYRELPPAIHYMRCAIAIPDMLAYLQTVIHDRAIGYLVVDSLGPSAGGELNDAATALAWFRAVRALNVGVLAVAHVPKEGDEIYGSIYWHNMPRATWRVVPDKGADETLLNVSFRHRKSNDGPIHRPFSYTLHFEPGSVAITAAR